MTSPALSTRFNRIFSNADAMTIFRGKTRETHARTVFMRGIFTHFA
jgi:hypothetical protein